MAKLAFLSLFLSTLTFTISAAPVTDLQASIQNGRMPQRYEQDGLNRQVDNRMDRGRSFAMSHDHDMTAGYHLNELNQQYKPEVSALPDQDEIPAIVSKLECYCGVSEEIARDMIDRAYELLSARDQSAIKSEQDGIYEPACAALKAEYDALP